MANRKSFVLTGRLLTSLKTRGKAKACRSCGKEFEVGDEVLSIVTPSSQRWYCEDCRRKLKIWLP